MSRGCVAAHTVLWHCNPISGNSAPITRCCNDYDFCNRDVVVDRSMIMSSGTDRALVDFASTSSAYKSDDFTAATEVEKKSKSRHDQQLTIILAVVLGAVGIALLLGVLYVVIAFNRRCSRRHNVESSKCTSKVSFHLTVEVDQLIEQSFSSGSGAGAPHLSQKTISRHLRLVDTIGKGRFGEVWKAEWQKQAVAVKIFHSREEESWLREVDLYQVSLISQKCLGLAIDVCKFCNVRELQHFFWRDTNISHPILSYPIISHHCRLFILISVDTDVETRKYSWLHCCRSL